MKRGWGRVVGVGWGWGGGGGGAQPLLPRWSPWGPKLVFWSPFASTAYQGPRFHSHGFKINLREDDLCLCHRSETVSHFFLDCFLYQEERDELFKKISQYLPGFQTFSKTKKLEIILYGFNLSNIEPDPRNISIVFAVQKYIMKPNVFTLHPPPPLPPLQHNHLTPTHTPHLTLSHLLLCWLSLPTFFFLAAPGVELFPQAQHSDYTVFGFDVMTSFAT